MIKTICDSGEYEESHGCYENGKLSIEDLYNQINDFYRQILEEKERTFAEIITKYDFIVGSKELKVKLTEILPEGASIVCSPFIEDATMIYAVKKFDVMDLLQEPYKEENSD